MAVVVETGICAKGDGDDEEKEVEGSACESGL